MVLTYTADMFAALGSALFGQGLSRSIPHVGMYDMLPHGCSCKDHI